MVSEKHFSYTTQLLKECVGFARYIVKIPPHVIIDLPKGKKRVTGLMNGAPFSQQVQYMKDGTQYFSVNARLRDDAAIQPGDNVKIIFRLIHADQALPYTHRDTKPGLDDDAGRIWNGITPGLNRTLSHYVDTVKKIDSRMRFLLEGIQRSVHQPKYGEKRRKRAKNS